MKLLLKIKERDKNRLFYLLLLVGLVVVDGTITRFIIKNRLGVEANPLLQDWVQSDTLLIVKLAGSVLAVLILWRLYLKSHKILWILTSFFVVMYSALVIWNIIAFYIASRSGI